MCSRLNRQDLLTSKYLILSSELPSILQLPSCVFVFLLFCRSSRQSLVQVRREPIPQLASIRRQIQRHLPHLIHHHPPGALVSAVSLSALQLFTLTHARHNGPHEKVGNVDGHGLGKAGELGGVGADDGWVALGVEREDLEAADALGRVLALLR